MHEYTKSYETDLVVYVSKVGGGTLGHMYDGDWEVIVQLGGVTVMDDIISSNVPKYYYQIADLAVEFLSDVSEV